MRVEYSKRAVSDIRQIAAYYDRSAIRPSPNVSWRAFKRLWPKLQGRHSGARLFKGPAFASQLLLNYRYKIFYRVAGDTIRIIPVRHPPPAVI